MSRGKNKRKQRSSPVTPGASRPEPRAAQAPLDQLLLAGDSGKRELWVYLAWMIFAAFGGMVFFLGSRPGGTAPVAIYMQGRVTVALAGLLVLAFGFVLSAVRRPFFQRGRARAMIALALVVGVANFPFPYPSSHEGHPSSVAFQLPVEGEWTVFWGGESKESNRLAGFYPDRRWGLHLVKAVDGSTHRGEGERVEDYHDWDQPVLAPAAGEVVVAHDGEPQAPLGRLARGGEAHGNYLVLRVAEGQYCFLTHLRGGSLQVSVGDQVVVGQELARVGFSGLMPLTPEPHVELFLQDTPDPLRGEAIPWRFHGYLADGKPTEPGLPLGGVAADGTLLGQRVRRADPR
jgi:hypothetical protein